MSRDTQEIQDRYGELPKETENFRELIALETQMRQLQLRTMDWVGSW